MNETVENVLGNVDNYVVKREEINRTFWAENPKSILDLFDQELNKEAIRDILIVKELAQQLYGDNWDMKIYYMPRLEDYILSIDKFDLILYIPEATLTNSRKQFIFIKGVYPVISFEKGSKDFFHASSFTLFRDNYSLLQAKMGYVHSHCSSVCNSIEDGMVSNLVNSGSKTLGYQKFCTNTNEFATLSAQLKSEHNLNTDILSLLLISIKDIINWESLEGVPYFRMNNVSLYKLLPILDNYTLLNRYNSITRDYKDELNFNLDINNGYYYIKDDDDRLDKSIVDIIKSHYNTIDASRFLSVKDKIGVHYSTEVSSDYNRFGWNLEDFNNISEPLKPHHFYRGKKKYLVIEESYEKEASTDVDVYAHPKFKKYVKTNIEKQLNYPRIKKGIIDRLST